MTKRIYHLANLSVARGCGFAMIAVVTTVVGLSNHMDVALTAGGLMCLIGCLVLVMKAIHASRQPYKSTEVWLMLEPQDRPNAAIAQTVISVARRGALLQFAHYAAWLAAAQFAASILWRLFSQSDG